MNLNISPKIEGYLNDSTNPHFWYDLLGLLKSELVSRFYINADEECPDVMDIIGLAKNIGAISAYAYLGDVENSVTGDKKARKFEDDYIERLFDVIKGLGFNAVTYMPSRNSAAQLEKVRRLCDSYGFFQISGEDINSSRQSFVCQALRDEKFNNLFDSTWALVGHELAATEDLEKGMFSVSAIKENAMLEKRIRAYKEIGLRLSPLKQTLIP